MTDINKLFFEVIRVAIGNQVCLSRSPSAADWQTLYDMALKQSLLGICFAGVQKLQAQRQAPPEMLYLRWMGMAAKIQQRNDVLNRQCVEVQEKLSDAGMQSTVLKGQGVALYYEKMLQGLRQSGDIDLWVGSSITSAVRYAKAINKNTHFDYLHVNLDVFKDTEVEMHYRPGCMYNLIRNKHLQDWVETFDLSRFEKSEMGFTVPSLEFNVVYILQHAYRHLINGGVGLRQMMDYYFVLKEVQTMGNRGVKITEFENLLMSFGMMRFAKAVMWIMQEVFGLSKDYMICEPNENEGSFLLDEIIMGGNFGHHDSRKGKHKAYESKWGILMRKIKTNMHLLTHYPGEVLSAPIYFVWHYIWKRKQSQLN